MPNETESTEVTQQQPPALTLNDLKVCLQIIDICSQRGAFKPEEFAAVGAVHLKLTSFITYASATANEAPADEAKDSDAATTQNESEETKND